MKWLKYVQRAFAIGAIMAVQVPKIMADGKVTVPEMVEFVTQIFEVGGWKLYIDLPESMKTQSFTARVE